MSFAGASTRQPPEPGFRWTHLLAVVVLSAAYESLFVGYGVNATDEGWALYAAWGVERGGQLYRDVLWVFPPGHLLAAWLGRLIDPPGIVVARAVYAVFAVAAVGSLYLLAARLLPARFAFLAAALVAVAAPDSHIMHVIFGYRYLVFSALALVLFDRWLRRGDRRWLFAAGLLLGVSACFRLEPAFAGACGIGVGVLAAERSLRRGLANGLVAAAGVLLVMVPVATWLSLQVGPTALWREVVTRPATMLALQSLPFPELLFPTDLSDRHAIRNWFAAIQFRTIWFLYAGYLVALAAAWIRARSDGRCFEHALLAAVVTWGGVFFVRSATRSDLPHLESVIPPVCLLFTYGAHELWARGARERLAGAGRRAWAERALVAALLASWIGLQATDLWLPLSRRGEHPVQVTGPEIHVHQPHTALLIDEVIGRLRGLPPDATILDMTASPLIYVLAERPGPGASDIVMPGTFLDPEEEERFLARVTAAPPAAVVWPRQPFDNRQERSLVVTAPRLSRWVAQHYRPVGRLRRWTVLLPVAAPAARGPFPPAMWHDGAKP